MKNFSYFDSSKINFNSDFNEKFKKFEWEFEKFYFSELEKLIKLQILHLENGIMPSNEEIKKHLIKWLPNNTFTWKNIPIVISEGIESETGTLKLKFKVLKIPNE